MKIDRIHRIHELLKQVRSISLNELCETFQVSKNTIRRDVAELEAEGLIRKVYGGIVLADSEAQPGPEPFAAREVRNSEAKQQIARLAAGFVHDGDVIYVDSGTTTMHMIPHLAERQHLTIVTASLHVINAAAGFANLNIIATGGTLYMPSKAFIGPSVLNCLSHYNIAKAFLASTGISIEHGATNASPLECEVKKTLIGKAHETFLLVDSSKFDVASLMSYCELKELDHIITDEEPSGAYTSYCQKHDIDLLTAHAPAQSLQAVNG